MPRRVRAIDQHTPQRSCIGCRRRRPWNDLVRITRAEADGRPTIVVDGPSSGRGAWLCRSASGGVDHECRDLAIKRNQFARAWRSTVNSNDVAAIRDAT